MLTDAEFAEQKARILAA
ncbi:hypothetical protein [Lactiplantibacillus plantarum]